MKFVRDLYPNAIFNRVYNAQEHGWGSYDFHRCCNKKGWTLVILKTTKGYIFGGFTTLDWESSGKSKVGG